MMFVDISPPKDRLVEFLEAETLVFDHHPTAESVVRVFDVAGLGVYKNGMDVCGASIVYEHVFYPLTYAREDRTQSLSYDLARLAAIRDNFDTSNPDWNLACAQSEVITFYPWKHWDRHAPFLQQHEMDLGKVLLEKNQERIEWIAKNAMHTSYAGLNVAVFQANGRLTSDVFEHLRKTEGMQVGIGFNFIKEDDGRIKIICAVRSTDDFDTGTFCKNLGGGGHFKAGGFNIDINHDESPYKSIKRLLEQP
jgi:hypothetical protein